MKKLIFALALLIPTEASAATWRKAGESLDWKTPPKGSVIEGALQAICATNKRIVK